MYKLLLILRYLRKRRIAWVSLVAVMLCTALMLVVISVMGGWLRMFRQSFHGLQGDVIVSSVSMSGFPYYEEMVKRIEALPDVGPGNAVPVIKTFGLVNLNNRVTEGVQVLGYPIDKIGNVNEFPKSLYRQYIARQEAAEKFRDPNLKLTDDERAYYEKLAADKSPPSFDLVHDIGVHLTGLPPGLVFPPDLKAKLTYLPAHERKPSKDDIEADASGMPMLICHGVMSDEERDRLSALSNDPEYRIAIRELYEFSDFRRSLPNKVRGADPSTWPGIILGEGVAHIRKDPSGRLVGRDPTIYRVPVKLTVLGIPPEGSPVSLENKQERPYWIVDDSRTKVYQYDSSSVYVPFDQLQKDLAMTEQKSDDGSVVFPARTSEIDVRIKGGADLYRAKDAIERACQSVIDEQINSGARHAAGNFNVQTWEESNRVWLHAIENEKVLVMFLFGLISIVAVFLIFCIFYMIVVEKTRDIGIIKSVGATSGGVAGIFLGYGLVIGILGGGLGLLLAWLIVHNINELHAWLGRVAGIVIWDPQVYAFDTIPNRMDARETTWIVIVAIVAAVLGAQIPAMRAAKLNPVDSLRWE